MNFCAAYCQSQFSQSRTALAAYSIHKEALYKKTLPGLRMSQCVSIHYYTVFNSM